MRATRMREGRGNKWIIIGSVLIVVVIVVVLGAFFTGAFGSDSNSGKGNGSAAVASTPSVPDTVAAPAATDSPPAESDASSSASKTKVVPEADFGEILSDGWVSLVLPSGVTSETWYTLQVNTATQANTFLFATYNDDQDITSTVKIENYAKGQTPTNAEVTLFHGEEVQRVLYFDGDEGTLSVTQTYSQPAGPSIFSTNLRVRMFYDLELEDTTGQVHASMKLDLSGLQTDEALILKRPANQVVASVLAEVAQLVDQIETKRAG